jgi:hypothetical protein
VWPLEFAQHLPFREIVRPFFDLPFAWTTLRAILPVVSLSLAISIRASIMSMSSISTTTSTPIIKTKTTGASGEVRNS